MGSQTSIETSQQSLIDMWQRTPITFTGAAMRVQSNAKTHRLYMRKCNSISSVLLIDIERTKFPLLINSVWRPIRSSSKRNQKLVAPAAHIRFSFILWAAWAETNVVGHTLTSTEKIKQTSIRKYPSFVIEHSNRKIFQNGTASARFLSCSAPCIEYIWSLANEWEVDTVFLLHKLVVFNRLVLCRHISWLHESGRLVQDVRLANAKHHGSCVGHQNYNVFLLSQRICRNTS